ncbi:MAG: hypothetical protein RLY86_647 [Pseudomonadota bacterium]
MSTALTARPHSLVHGFLGLDLAAELLDCVFQKRDEMKPTGVGYGETSRIDETFRRSTVLRDLGVYREKIIERATSVEPAILADLHIKPFERSRVEVEIVAHGDGAFCRRHIDTATGTHHPKTPRRLSMVWYAFRTPKAFTGGALRLYPITGTEYTDIEPQHDMMVDFPSWMPHEVMPVSVPTGRFEDSRFAMNIWVSGT